MIDTVILLPLFTLGLVSGAHCIGMCGGIMGALGMAIPAEAKAKRWAILVAYNLGRISSYTLIGLLAGMFAAQFAALGGGMALRVLAGFLLIAMGLYMADWWRGLTRLEALGRYLWVYIQPLGRGLMPVDNLPKALLLGMLWGWLPCGLVYTALAMAMTQPAPGAAAGAMLAFGAGTLPAVLLAGIAAQQLARFLQRRQVRVALALLIIVFGVWTIWGASGHSHGHHRQHQAVESMDHSAMDHSAIDHSIGDHAEIDHATMDHSATDHRGMDHSNAEDSHVHHNPSSEMPSERQRTEQGDKLIHNQNSSHSAETSGGHNSNHH